MIAKGQVDIQLDGSTTNSNAYYGVTSHQWATKINILRMVKVQTKNKVVWPEDLSERS